MISGVFVPNTQPSRCEYASATLDCDGDLQVYCFCQGNCPYKKTIIDCDGDVVKMCER